MGKCDRNCVILWASRARCPLHVCKEIRDLLNEESVPGMHSVAAAILYRFDEKSTASV